MRSLDPPVIVTPAGPEPAYCPRCELRHTRRPDWMCPRCGSPVTTDVPAPRPTEPPPPPPPFPLGSRLAGALLLLASVGPAASLWREVTGLAAAGGRWRALAAVAAAAALGIGLLAGAKPARWVGLALAAATALVLAEGLLRDLRPGLLRDPLPTPARQLLRDLVHDHRPARMLALLGFAAGCGLLVAGRPRRRRLAAGLLLAAPLLALRLAAAWGR